MASTKKQRILVVGAGASGLTSIKACQEEGLDVVCYERSKSFGGLWRYQETVVDNQSSVMKCTISNTSKEMSAFSDFPPPKDFPIYAPHEGILKYLQMYAEHFNLLQPINYCQEVMEIIPSEDYSTNGQWMVKIRDLRQGGSRNELFDGVMVCSGHHAFPLTPSYPGSNAFQGQMSHSHNYRTFNGYEDKTVLVVGAGNSGADIAVDLSNIAAKVYLSTRRGAWIYPRFLNRGKVSDVALARRYLIMEPASLYEAKILKHLNKAMDHEKYGIKPYHSVGKQHPTINDELKCKLGSGLIILKKDVKEFTENGAKFDGDDEVTKLDAVIFATGYSLKFPFLSDDIVKVGKNNKISLYKFMFPPQLKHPSLAMVGLIQPNGGLFPVFEIQARWFGALMAGHCRLPSCDEMLSDVRKMEDFKARNFVQSSRHTIEANRILYMDDIAAKIGANINMTALAFKDPKLFKACLMGPCLPYHYRLFGPHKWTDARETALTYKDRLYGCLEGNKR